MPAGATELADRVIATCPVCRRSLALGDRSGRHVASEAHYPRVDASGAKVCSPPTGAVHLGVGGESRPAPLRLAHTAAR